MKDKKLRLPLKKKWFDLTKSGEKKEDYREINNYWFRRFFGRNFANSKCTDEELYCMLTKHKDFYVQKNNITLFDKNVMTLGYPKNTDTERILILEHKGIDIGFGRKEWGAEEGKKYFIIKHGVVL